ncbi:hypothetical protein DL89DRAFT_119441 [Linderina pennispora]|uniref:BZIP domain-containing protein n=1 Tax=Linderina pennispora TaxID=61395 RepID=A0A1Y1WCL2_9FUNG|nr:uncharacterized protein DL89DRAFT_119441 [Linderina pennispora]ORX71068.1 hypothetical protein DL89DRAFT_119441 [Linderina pennispora]
MAVDEPTAVAPKKVAALPKPKTTTIQQQALSTAGKKSASSTTPQQPANQSQVRRATVSKAQPPKQQQQQKSPAAAAPSAPSGGDRAMSEEHEAELEGVDLKNMSSKERRQLRNKISARNFRVRRKEYISNLEAEVRQHREEADGLRKELTTSKAENSQLREEVAKLRLKLSALTVAASSPAPVPTVAAQSPVPVPKPTPAASPVVRFNPRKDVGQSKAAGNWAAKSSGSGFIAVNTAFVDHAQNDTVLREAQRKRAVDALLSMRDESDAFVASEATRCAALALAGLVAELVLSQTALESSIHMAHKTAAIAAADAQAAVSC